MNSRRWRAGARKAKGRGLLRPKWKGNSLRWVEKIFTDWKNGLKSRKYTWEPDDVTIDYGREGRSS